MTDSDQDCWATDGLGNGCKSMQAGETAHRVWGRGADGGETLLHEFRGVTRDMQVLEVTPDSPWRGIRTLKIETLSSPSWVSWREIEVISDSGRP